MIFTTCGKQKLPHIIWKIRSFFFVPTTHHTSLYITDDWVNTTVIGQMLETGALQSGIWLWLLRAARSITFNISLPPDRPFSWIFPPTDSSYKISSNVHTDIWRRSWFQWKRRQLLVCQSHYSWSRVGANKLLNYPLKCSLRGSLSSNAEVMSSDWHWRKEIKRGTSFGRWAVKQYTIWPRKTRTFSKYVGV